jgi:hypothetical protein
MFAKNMLLMFAKENALAAIKILRCLANFEVPILKVR